MNHTWRFHYADYSLAENEKLYADMARKGWLLKRRGSYLSSFVSAPPQERIYRIELATTGFFDDPGLPEEQIAFYEECGWELVSVRGLVHVFCAPGDSPVRELYTDPAQQAGMLRSLRRSYLLTPLYLLFYIAFLLLLSFGAASDVQSVLDRNLGALYRVWIDTTSYALFLTTLLISGFYHLIRGAIHTRRLYRTLRRGQPIDRTVRKQWVHKTVTVTSCALCVFFALCTLIQFATIRKYDMPLQDDAPYLMFSELGLEGERTTSSITSHQNSNVEVGRSFLVRRYHTYECLSADNITYTLYNTVYECRHIPAQQVVRMLMYEATFTNAPEEWTPVSIPGLDAAYRGRLGESIGVKDEYVWYFNYFHSAAGSETEDLYDPLAALAQTLCVPAL